MVWDAKLEVQAWPTPGTTRVDWGQVLIGVCAEVTHRPADARRDVELRVFIVDPDGNRRDIESHTRMTAAGCASVELGDRSVVRVGAHPEQLVCPRPGKYRLGTEWREGGRIVASASQYLHVRCDPVAPPLRPLSASLTVELPDVTRRRVNHGERINVVLRVVNRGLSPVDVGIEMSLGGLTLASKTADELRVPGVPAGGMAEWRELRIDGVRVLTHTPDAPLGALDVVLETGRHRVAADLWAGNPLAAVIHVSSELFVNTDPAGAGGGAPFEVVAFEDDLPRRPLWTLERPAVPSGVWTLKYSRSHPKYLGAENVDRLLRDRRTTGSTFHGTAAFWAETHCSALIEWALTQYVEQRDEGPFQLIRGEESDGNSASLWEAYNSAVDSLLSGYGDPLQCMDLKRRVLSAMLRVVEHEGVS